MSKPPIVGVPFLAIKCASGPSSLIGWPVGCILDNLLIIKFPNISEKNNPPRVSIEFYQNIKNLKNINCFSNEEDKWRSSNIDFKDNYNLNVNLEGKFITERGRINCSLREKNGFYRWLGVQFVVKEK